MTNQQDNQNHQNYQNNVGNPGDGVWNLVNNLMMESNHHHDFAQNIVNPEDELSNQRSQEIRNQLEDFLAPQHGLAGGRTDSINSTTLFVSPQLIQPQHGLRQQVATSSIFNATSSSQAQLITTGSIGQQNVLESTSRAGTSIATGSGTRVVSIIENGAANLTAADDVVLTPSNVQYSNVGHNYVFTQIQPTHVMGNHANTQVIVEDDLPGSAEELHNMIISRRGSTDAPSPMTVEQTPPSPCDLERTHTVYFTEQDAVGDNTSSSSRVRVKSESDSVEMEGHAQFVLMNERSPLQEQQNTHHNSQERRKVAIPPHQLKSGQHPSPTGMDVSLTDFPGHLLFDVKFVQISNNAKNKSWGYSTKLKKLYIDINRWVQVNFSVGPNPPEDLTIRALPVYGDAPNIREPVRRCTYHSDPGSDTNKNFQFVNHLIRFQNEETQYEKDDVSERLSTVFNVGNLHEGADFCTQQMKFMCLGSCAGGINRRPVKIVFTLEINRKVVGRKVIDVRICSCPRRDLQQEENKHYEKEEKARELAARFATSTRVPVANMQNNQNDTIMMPPPGKRLKIDSNKDQVIMVPVHADDFRKINEFAEAAWVCRDPSKADAIKEHRRRLLQQHNEDLLKKLGKKPAKK